MSQAAWSDALLQHIAARRSTTPVAAIAVDWELQIQGGSLQTLLQKHMRNFVIDRRILPILELEPDPVIVLHGDMHTLAACTRLLGEDVVAGRTWGRDRGLGRVVALLDDEYDAFLRAHPEPREFVFHISSWSRFRDADPSLLERAVELGRPIDASLTYRGHVEGTLWGPRCGFEAEHLWSWNGAAPALVEEAIRHVRF